MNLPISQVGGRCVCQSAVAARGGGNTGTEIPESLRYYIDWQALARDMALNGEIMVFQTGFDEVHIFWSR